MQKVYFEDLGRISYQKAWDYQAVLMKELIDRKLKARKEGFHASSSSRIKRIFRTVWYLVLLNT